MKLKSELRQNLYTGQWQFEGASGSIWIFYFRLGRLNWCETNQLDPLSRYLKSNCPELQLQITQQNLKTIHEKRDFLMELYQEKLVHKETLAKIVSDIAQEFLFDIFQAQQTEEIKETQPSKEIPNLPPLTEIDRILKAAEENWQEWCNANLAEYSPNTYPIIQEKNALTQEFISVIDGRQSLRELAWNNNKNLLAWTETLKPLLNSGAIVLSPTPMSQEEIDELNRWQKSVDSSASATETTVPLAATVKKFRGSSYLQQSSSYFPSINQAKELLQQGNIVKLVVNFQGQNNLEMTLVDELCHRLEQEFQDWAKVKQISDLNDGHISIWLSPQQ